MVMVDQDHKSGGGGTEIREVWAWNAAAELETIGRLIARFPVVAMDTEFPGVIHGPTKKSVLQPWENYSYVKANVDVLTLIQVGLTLSDHHGNLPTTADCSESDSCESKPHGGVIWEFNLSDFDPAHHLHSPDSIALLRRQGIDFHRNRTHGIPSNAFADLLGASALIRNPAVSWITFHSAYDFAYLIKILTRRLLPESLSDFHCLLTYYFGPCVYDVKHLMRFCHSLHGGLDRIAAALQVPRAAGKSHQAASDSLLTCHVFLRMRHLYFLHAQPHHCAGVLYGLEHHRIPSFLNFSVYYSVFGTQ